MAIDIFLELTGVAGEAQDKTMKDKKAIDILAWSWGLSQSGTTHMGKGGGAGKVNVQDISLTKYVDASSATLMQFCCQGKHIDKGTLTLRKAGGGDTPVSYMVIEFEELLVSAISTGGSGGEDRFTENVTLNFRQFNFKYKLQEKTGSGSDEKTWKWDVAQNASA